MTTTIEDAGLETELQELYLVGKQWISDLEFVETELEMLHKLFIKASFILVKRNFDKLYTLKKVQENLKTNIQTYLQRLGSLIVEPKQNIEISLVSAHTQLEHELQDMMQGLQSFKNAIFRINKRSSKELPATVS